MDCIGLSHGGVCLCEVVPVGLPLAWTCQVEFVATWLFRSLFILLFCLGQVNGVSYGVLSCMVELYTIVRSYIVLPD